jgi:hypothetical protein
MATPKEMLPWKERLQKFRKWLAALPKKLSVFAIAGTIIGFWISYQDKIEIRHAAAWSTLREAIKWSVQSNWGNVGHMTAIETLTRHCDSWWQGTLFEYAFAYFFQDCVALNSLYLMRMDLGGVNAAGANFSGSNLSCANFASANLRRANLQRVDFRASELSGADLRGADLSQNISMRLANLSWARMDRDTKFDPQSLKCACISVEVGANGQSIRHELVSDAPAVRDVAGQMKACPPELNRCDDPALVNWACAQ